MVFCCALGRGLETLHQLVLPNGQIASAPIWIQDKPAFPWRGLLVDTSRHFIPVPNPVFVAVERFSTHRLSGSQRVGHINSDVGIQAQRVALAHHRRSILSNRSR